MPVGLTVNEAKINVLNNIILWIILLIVGRFSFWFVILFPSADKLRQNKCLNEELSSIRTKNKSGQRHDRKAGQGVWPAALKLFSVLIFLVLFVSRQKGLASAAIEREGH